MGRDSREPRDPSRPKTEDPETNFYREFDRAEGTGERVQLFFANKLHHMDAENPVPLLTRFEKELRIRLSAGYKKRWPR